MFFILKIIFYRKLIDNSDIKSFNQQKYDKA